jgi:ATP-dependent RNA helicase DDX52/ROK1
VAFRCALPSIENSNDADQTWREQSWNKGLDVLISTPLRLCSCLLDGVDNKKAALDLSRVRLIALDEADRLLESGDGADDINDASNNNNSNSQSSSAEFLTQIDTILAQCNKKATRALFSATMGPNVKILAESILRDAIEISVGSNLTGGLGANSDIDQQLLFVGKEEGKLLAIRQLIQEGITPPTLIFLQSKERAQALFNELLYDGINVDVIHSGRSQHMRDEAVRRFRIGETWVLIATDLIARGIDFKAVNMVINYDFPTSGVTYVHRIGRTGRAGRKGKAITYFTESDFDGLRSVANIMKISGCEVPDWMLKLKKERTDVRKRKEKYAPKRKNIDTQAEYKMVVKKKRLRAQEEQENQQRSNSNNNED